MKIERISTAVLVVLCLVANAPLHARDDEQLRRLTSDPAQDGFPCWSPDGTTIVFSRVDDAPGRTGLWSVPAAGGAPRQLTDFIAEHPSWSPDGHYIVFDADRGNSIKLISSAGGTPVRVVPESIGVFRGGNPNWSPDASKIAFRQGSNLWVVDVSTGELTNVFHETGTLPIPGCWSRDGKDIYVCLRSEDAPDSTIWVVSSAGNGKRRLPVEKERVYRYMDLSPDGSLLAVVACEGRNCDLWIMPADGGKQIRMTAHSAYDDTPRWSPDGSTIAFTSTRSGNFDVWIIELDIDAIRAELGTPDAPPDG